MHRTTHRGNDALRKASRSMPHSKKSSPALEATEAGPACVVDTGSKNFASKSLNTTFERCCEANPPQKKGPFAAAVGQARGKGRTVGSCRNPTSYPLTQLRTQESLAQAVCTKIFSVERKAPAIEQPGADAKFADTRRDQGASVRRASPLGPHATTFTNAWLPKRHYRVDECLRVEVLP